MNGFILLIPFLLVRFGLIRVIDRQAVVRAAYFPPRIGAERAAYMIYQLANAVVLIGLLFSLSEWSGPGYAVQALPVSCWECCCVSLLSLILPRLRIQDFTKTGSTVFHATRCMFLVTCFLPVVRCWYSRGCWDALYFFLWFPPIGSSCQRSGGASRPSARPIGRT